MIEDCKSNLPLSYNNVIFRKNIPVNNQMVNQITKSDNVKQFYKPITRF